MRFPDGKKVLVEAQCCSNEGSDRRSSGETAIRRDSISDFSLNGYVGGWVNLL